MKEAFSKRNKDRKIEEIGERKIDYIIYNDTIFYIVILYFTIMFFKF